MLRGFVYTQISYLVISNCINIVHFLNHTPHSFVLPQSTQQWGKISLHIEGSSLLISTSLCASPSEVGLQDCLSHWSFTIHPFIGTHVLVCRAHTSNWGMPLIPSVTTPSQVCKYCLPKDLYSSRFCSPLKHTIVGGVNKKSQV